MNNSNYMIAVDENGQPYIAHTDSLFSKARQAGAKYYNKIKTSYGTRYFYDKDEWDAYVKGQGAKPTSLLGKAKDKLGFDERARRNSAADKANNYEQKTEKYANDANRLFKLQNDYKNTTLGKAETAKVVDRFQRMKDELQKDAKFSEYDANDPDFSDENLKKAERIGDSDFLYFVRSDGRPVILEEDMKWVLPKGTDMTSPAFQEFIKKQDKAWNSMTGSMARASWNSAEERSKAWRTSVTDMINEAVRNSKQK